MSERADHGEFVPEICGDYDPKTVAYAPSPGRPVRGQTPEQLAAGAAAHGWDLEALPDGTYMAVSQRNQDGVPSMVHVWDRFGRLSRVDWCNNVSVTDRSGEWKSVQSPIFSNEYTYDEAGLLIYARQVVTQNDLTTTYTYRCTEYFDEGEGWFSWYSWDSSLDPDNPKTDHGRRRINDGLANYRLAVRGSTANV